MYLRLIFVITSCFLFSCGNGIDSRFPMDKRFWEPEDYKNVYRKIRYNNPEGERYPELKNGETAPAFKKIVDRQNFKVVLEDTELGLSHRNSLATDFFNATKDFSKIYSATDRQDRFVYGMELVEFYKFFLDLQIHYFKLGNQNIIKEADNPDASSVTSVLRSNEKVIYKNYNNYLDYVNKENSFTESEIISYCEGIDSAFPILFETFPEGNTNITKNKAELMLKKTENDLIQKSLEQLLNNISQIKEDRQEQ